MVGDAPASAQGAPPPAPDPVGVAAGVVGSTGGSVRAWPDAYHPPRVTISTSASTTGAMPSHHRGRRGHRGAGPAPPGTKPALPGWKPAKACPAGGSGRRRVSSSSPGYSGCPDGDPAGRDDQPARPAPDG